MASDELSTPQHWDSREGVIRPRAPSRLNVGVRDLTNLFARHIRPGSEVLEIGCAPGKYLLWCAMVARAKVSGLEYAPKSFEQTAQLFRETGTQADIRCEDVFTTSLQNGTFDLVYSIGLIEHFTGQKLTEIVHKHAELLKPGGTAVIIVPNFSGWYGALLKRNDPDAYATHNIDMMNVDTLESLCPPGATAKAYRYGMLTPWIVTYTARGPVLNGLAMYAANFAGLLQPFKINALCPWLVLEIRSPEGSCSG